MKTLIAAVTLAAASSAFAVQLVNRNLAVQCWPTAAIAKLVETKTFLVARYYEAHFLGGEGYIAELIHAKDMDILFFAIDKEAACMIAVSEPSIDDLKRVGLK